MNIGSHTTFRTHPSVSQYKDHVTLSSVARTPPRPDPEDEFLPGRPEVSSPEQPVTFSKLSGRLFSEFAEYFEKLPGFFSRLEELNPAYSFVVRRSLQDKLSLRVRHNGKPHFLVEFDSSGKTLSFHSPDEELAARQRLSMTGRLPALLEQMGLKRPSEAFPAMARAFSPEAVMMENRKRLLEPAPDLAVCKTVAIASTMFKKLDKLETEAAVDKMKTVETARLKLQESLANLAGDNTKRNLLALQEASDYIATMTTAPDKEYKVSLKGESYQKRLKRKLLAEGAVLYSHGQPFWRLRSTIVSGELSSPALRGLVPETDCSFVNICVNRHNAGGFDGGGESLSYALRGELHPAGALFLVKPSALDNFPGQPATRNVVFRPGDEDGRLVKILVADKTLPQVRSWLSAAGLDPALATGYLEYVSNV